MRGHTLLELTVVLLLMTAITSSMAPAARRWQDRAAVVAAREIVVGLLSRARVEAMRSGSARVSIESGPARARALVADRVVDAAEVERDLGVRIELGGGRTSTVVAYDALGLGRMAAATLVFRRGDATASLVISGLGRARRP